MEIFLLIASTIGALAGIAITTWIHSHVFLKPVIQPVSTESQPGDLPYLSVIIPARNEARNIRRCIQALLDQTYPAFEIIVVDDRSTDQTPQILHEIQTSQYDTRIPLKVIRGAELPADWAGKPHALMQGVRVAQGEWLCFIDADTFGSPTLLLSTIMAAEELDADLLSILTEQELVSPWEKILLPLVFTALSVGFSPRRVNDPAKRDAIANGQFILIRRSVYDAVGGHQAIHDQIVEDKALAEKVKGFGYRIIMADGRQLARTRMYTSFAEIWEGWTKNIFLGMRERLGLLTLGITTGLLGALLLPVWLISSLAAVWIHRGSVDAIMAFEAVFVWGYVLFWRVRASAAFNISPLYALTLPLGMLVFTAMMVTSSCKVLTGSGVTWKGRLYKG